MRSFLRESSLPLLVNIMIYLVLVPILVFFFLKDREMIGQWVRGYLPRERALITRVAQEMNRQIAAFVSSLWERAPTAFNDQALFSA